MARKRYTAEPIIGTLWEAEVALAQGENVGQGARRLGVAEPPDSRGRREDGGRRVDQATRRTERERANGRRKTRSIPALTSAASSRSRMGMVCALQGVLKTRLR